MRSYGTGFEINTSGYRHGVGDNFPCNEFIVAALSAGVSTVTLGSDSHYCDTVGYRGFESALLLKSLGQKSVSTFMAHRESRIPVDGILDSFDALEVNINDEV